MRVQRAEDIEALIAEERLKPEPTKRFIENAFRDGELRTTGTDLDLILPPMPRFGANASKVRDEKKRTIVAKLQAFFEKYSGIVDPQEFIERKLVSYQEEDKTVFTLHAAEKPIEYQ